jgi:hypothetical protein
MVVASTGAPIPKTNFFVKDASGNFVDIINLYDTSAPGTQTTNFITNGDSFNYTDLGKIFTPYIFGANSINFFTGATTDLGSKFAQIGKTSKYIATGYYNVTSNNNYNTIITFIGDGTIKFNLLPTSNSVLLVGAGGNGGAGNNYMNGGGGGGGGGVGVGTFTFNTTDTYNISIGALAGANSAISRGSSVIETAYGGGRGGRFDYNIADANIFLPSHIYCASPTSGGSGGGGMFGNYTIISSGTGQAPTRGSGTYLTYYGNYGGSTIQTDQIVNPGAGGGGAGGVGGGNRLGPATPYQVYYGGNGGIGYLFPANNSYYGGGGGGGGGTGREAGIGGTGGGGAGGYENRGTPGATSTGGGGGGGGSGTNTNLVNNDPGGGGSGVCIIAFNI